MKKTIYFPVVMSFLVHGAFAQSSTVIEPNNNNGILSQNVGTVTAEPDPVFFNTPVSGTGTRLMWLPGKSVFRVGTVTGNFWDTSRIGLYSFASGRNTVASGRASTAMGNFTEASGQYSWASGSITTASGENSTAIGYFTEASGNYSTAFGAQTTTRSYASTVLGYNNINDSNGNPESWVATDPLLVVGNGTDELHDNAITLLKNANLGLHTATPQYPLTFKDETGDKISFYYGNTTNTTNHYGIGIGAFQFQIFTPTSNDDIVFGFGRSAALTEKVRFKGNGNVGIGLNNPSELLDVNGRMRLRHKSGNPSGVWMSNSANSTATTDGAFYGLKSDTEAGILIGNAWRFLVTSAGNVTVGGTVTASCGVLVCSDARYKKNINPLQNALISLTRLNGVRYDWRKEEFPERNFGNNNQIGFIAQDIEKIFPEMVFTDEKGFKAVDYARLTPVLVEAIKELKQANDELKAKNERLEAGNQKLESRVDKIEAMLSK